MTNSASSHGYSRLSIITHWLSAIFVIALFVTHEADRGSAGQFFHVSIGAGIGIFLLWRVGRRIRKGFTQKPNQPAVLNLLSSVVIWGFLTNIVVVTVTGYLLPWSRGAPLDMMGIFTIPSPMQKDIPFHHLVETVHDVSGHLFIPLIALHLMGAVKHFFLDKDDITQRMMKPSGDK